MITLHHLEYSRSMRIAWLFEELGVDYELVRYPRDPNFRAPPELAKVHPLGKSPVIVDGGLKLAESSAILRYVEETYGKGDLTPPTGTPEYALHGEWLDYVESSAGLPIMITLLGGMTGGLSEKLQAFAAPQIVATLAYIAGGIGTKPYLMGDKLSLADIQMSYMLGLAKRIGALDDQPGVAAYFDRLQAEPGFLRAIERGGPMMPPARE
jgi:glutathione S-transferase